MAKEKQLIRLKRKSPDNETPTHYLLKYLGQYILYTQMNCKTVGVEIRNMQHYDTDMPKNKKIIDVCGITLHKDKVIGIEAKASLSDFNNGFSCLCPYTYVICPRDIIPVDKIPKNIGLIYVDLEILKIINNRNEVQGVEIVKRASKRIDSRFKSDRIYNNWQLKIESNINRRNAIYSVYNADILPMYNLR